MTGKPVAHRADDVVPTPSGETSYPTAAAPTAKGNWKVGEKKTTAATGIRCGGAVLVGATCEFVFTGTTTSTPVKDYTSPPSIVALVPVERVLRVSGSAPLVHGDTACDQYGNKLEIVSTAIWRTV